jgi:MYXO-CTERM domain-containing protein
LKIEWNGGNPQLRVDSFAIGSEYEQFSLSGIAPPTATGATITYAISAFNDGGGENNVYIDDFSATATPEPTSVLLGLVGLMGLVGLVRRR